MTKRAIAWIAAFAVLTGADLQAQDIAGDWQGTLASVGGTIRTVLEVSKAVGGGWRVAIFTDRAVYENGIAASSATLKDSVFTAVFDQIRSRYEGRVSADGSSIKGTWTQNGPPRPLELARATKETSWLYAARVRKARLDSILGLCAMGAKPGRPPVASHEAAASGVTFKIEPTPDGGPTPGLFTGLSGVVVFAAGRGRLDVVDRHAGPVAAVNGVQVRAPLGGSGDFYLFDSTGFILVKPASKTFTSFTLTDAAYDYQYSRAGWPDHFSFGSLKVDTLGTAENAAGSQAWHGPMRLFWHLDVLPRPSTRILAGGRLAIADVPAGEFSVARWFGVSEALANASCVPSVDLGLTAVAQSNPPGFESQPLELVTQHDLIGVKRVDVDLRRLVLPAGFSDTPWFGAEGSSADRGAKWRVLP